MNLANKLTIFRIILVPIMVIVSFFNTDVLFLGIPITYLIMDLIFIIASITDKLDGSIARKRNQITTFGKFLDPLADKILVLTAMIILVEIGKIPAWIPIIVMTREFIVSGYRLVAVEKGGEVIAASKWGKLKTVTQMIAIILAFIDKYNFWDFVTKCNFSDITACMTIGDFILNIITSLMFIIAVIATVLSGFDYLKGSKKLIMSDK